MLYASFKVTTNLDPSLSPFMTKRKRNPEYEVASGHKITMKRHFSDQNKLCSEKPPWPWALACYETCQHFHFDPHHFFMQRQWTVYIVKSPYSNILLHKRALIGRTLAVSQVETREYGHLSGVKVYEAVLLIR